MAAEKYAHLVKPISYRKLPGDDPEYLTFQNGAALEGVDLTFFWGYHRKVGPWGVGGPGGHVHSSGECFVFTGLDYNHPDVFPAEVEVALGEEGEKYLVKSPTIMTLPPGLQHCPIVTKKVDQPFGFLAITCDGKDKTTDLPARTKISQSETKYSHLVQKMEMRDMKRKFGGNADFISWWSGKNMENFSLNFTWAFHTGTGPWHPRDPHVHPASECLVFVGLDPDKPDYLGAEVQIAFGEEQEIHVFDKPTVVVVPAGLVHCPLITRQVERPYAFTAISLNVDHETTWLGEGTGDIYR